MIGLEMHAVVALRRARWRRAGRLRSAAGSCAAVHRAGQPIVQAVKLTRGGSAAADDVGRYHSRQCSARIPPATPPHDDPDHAARARPRVIEIEAAAVQALQRAARRGVRRGLPAAAGLPRPRRRDRHGQVRPHRHKIAATLASTGTPAFFLHPGEASHGDLGMITRRRRRAGAVELRRDRRTPDDPAGAQAPGHPADRDDRPAGIDARAAADVHLDVSVAEEACPLGLAPTSSTTAALGDGRCARGRAARSARLHRRRLRALASGRQPRPPPAAARHRRDARRRAGAAVGPDATLQRGAGGDDPQGPRHDRDRRRAAARCSACSPTATCAARSTSRSTCKTRRMSELMTPNPKTIGRGARGRSRAPDGNPQITRCSSSTSTTCWSARSTFMICCAPA